MNPLVRTWNRTPVMMIRDHKTTFTTADMALGLCPTRDDEAHCECWWDGEDECCSCSFDVPVTGEFAVWIDLGGEGG